MFRPLVLAAALVAAPVTAPAQSPLSQPAADALVHVIAHEIGHAMLREFDLPILGPEELISDDFATIYVHLTFPDRAAAIVAARARQNLADGQTAGRFDEYVDDDWRAGRSVCLLYGLDPESHADLARAAGLTGDAAAACRDSGPEVGRSWRRLIDAHRLPEGARVTEVRLTGDDIPLNAALEDSELSRMAWRMLAAIDWHSRITLNLGDCDGDTGWSRNRRQITICDAYVRRFGRQLGGE